MGTITGHQIGDKSVTRNNLITTMDRMLDDPELTLSILLKVSKEKESFYASGKFITTEPGTKEKPNALSDLGMDIVEKLEDHFNTEKHQTEDKPAGVSIYDILPWITHTKKCMGFHSNNAVFSGYVVQHAKDPRIYSLANRQENPTVITDIPDLNLLYFVDPVSVEDMIQMVQVASVTRMARDAINNRTVTEIDSSVSHTDALVKELRADPEFAKQYLIECSNDTENPLVLEYAIRNIIAAIGNKPVATELLKMFSNTKSPEQGIDKLVGDNWNMDHTDPFILSLRNNPAQVKQYLREAYANTAHPAALKAAIVNCNCAIGSIALIDILLDMLASYVPPNA